MPSARIQIASHESVEDANAAEILGSAITDALAKETDRAFALGAGPKGPTGLPGLTGVSTVTGDAKTMGVYADAIGKIEQAGGSPSVIFANPGDVGAIQKLPSVTGSNAPALSSASARWAESSMDFH
jgi:hypothetical protein